MKQPDERASDEQAQGEPAKHAPSKRSLPRQSRYLLEVWILLLFLGAFYIFASCSDLVADIRTGLPSDHLEAFHAIAGITWNSAKLASPNIAHYVTLLEIIYAVHELVFGLLFLLILVIPFRQRARWAWWACWVPMIANITYSLTIAHYSTTTLTYSLIADVILPILLLLHIPAFFGKSRFP
ncbi:hypothetical protein [Ktedonobacter sp. SOSP1-52]|uniref:hypothetical protein n=1 Tax=Ktedonobacter sp. SOSP1-52 TaxID=2778366 RepID=UPI0019161911|nr:hypothetical protein [Ktedonobacter sp. SOSP1-52]